MALMFDARIPVVFGNRWEAQEGDAVLADVSDRPPLHDAAGGHPPDPGCACCVARGPAAQALSRLFTQRALGEVAFFRRVLVDDPAAEAAVRAALESDPVAAARFRLAEAGPA